MQAIKVAVLALATLAACESKTETTFDDVKEQAQKTLDTAVALAAEQKDAYAARVRSKIDDIDAQLEVLADKSKDKKDQAKADLEAQIAKLEAQKAALEDKLAALKDKSGNAWDSAKDGLDDALEELEEGLADAKKKLE